MVNVSGKSRSPRERHVKDSASMCRSQLLYSLPTSKPCKPLVRCACAKTLSYSSGRLAILIVGEAEEAWRLAASIIQSIFHYILLSIEGGSPAQNMHTTWPKLSSIDNASASFLKSHAKAHTHGHKTQPSNTNRVWSRNCSNACSLSLTCTSLTSCHGRWTRYDRIGCMLHCISIYLGHAYARLFTH